MTVGRSSVCLLACSAEGITTLSHVTAYSRLLTLEIRCNVTCFGLTTVCVDFGRIVCVKVKHQPYCHLSFICFI
jgi:hypothetical protein